MTRGEYLLHVAVFVAMMTCPMVFSEENAETKSKPAAEKPKQVDDETHKRISDTLSKMDELDKQWQSDRGKSKAGEATKEDKKRADERKKAAEDQEKSRRKAEEKGAKSASRSNSSDSGVTYSSSSSSSGGWVEVGGVSRGSSFSSSGSGGSYRESGYSNSSIGTRATVIRLDGPQ